MKIVAFLRRLGRKLSPSGNRGSLDTEYRQPTDRHAEAEAEVRPPRPGNWPGWGGS